MNQIVKKQEAVSNALPPVNGRIPVNYLLVYFRTGNKDIFGMAADEKFQLVTVGMRSSYKVHGHIGVNEDHDSSRFELASGLYRRYLLLILLIWMFLLSAS